MTSPHLRVIGTAGHVDHGKSSLVLALTGTDPDTLPEERERGMTITLGFAFLHAPEADLRIGFVDVPGHERLIRTMVSGAGMLQGAVLVVAADDGWMPQTTEHLQILRLLRVPSVLPVISKVDLVDGARVDEVAALVTAHLTEAGWPAPPPVRFSTRQPETSRTLRDRLVGWAAALPVIAAGGPARMHFDRVLQVTGAGTIVAGTLLDAPLRVTDPVRILPQDLEARVKGLQIHGDTVEQAPPGSRVAVRLTSAARLELHRGQSLVTGGAGWATTWDGITELLPDVGPLSADHPIEVLIGTAVWPTRVSLLAGVRRIGRGQRAGMRITFGGTPAIKPLDVAILRRPSPPLTLGSWTAVTPNPTTARRTVDPEKLACVLASGAKAWLATEIARVGYIEQDAFAQRFPWAPSVLTDGFADPPPGIVVREGRYAVAVAIETEAVAALDRAWAAIGDGEGFDLERWQRDDGRLSPPAVAEWLARRAQTDAEVGHGRIFKRSIAGPVTRGDERAADDSIATAAEVPSTGPGSRSDAGAEPVAPTKPPIVELPGLPAPSGAPDADGAALLAELEGPDPPSIKELRARGPAVRQLLDRLIRTRHLVTLAGELVLPHARILRMASVVIAAVAEGQGFKVAEIKPRLGLSRRFVVPFLERLDDLGITRRAGDIRRSGPACPVRHSPQ